MAIKLGMEAKLLYKVGGQAGGGAWVVLGNTRDVTLNLEAGEADVTTRANSGWRATVATLKEASVAPPLADVTFVPANPAGSSISSGGRAALPAVITPASAGSLGAFLHPRIDTRPALVPTRVAAAPAAATRPSLNDRLARDPNVRWFNGRPVKPAKTMWMVVTGYSPDARSCGEFADGKTATLHSVPTNDHSLVAAAPRVLPYGSMVTVPGYDDNLIVPVLDCGGAIKGNRLDLLFPTHEEARQWGKKRIKVTIWQYADGKPMDNPRKLR